MSYRVISSYQKMLSYQILQLNEDDFSVGAQYFFVVTSTLPTGVGQQDSHQDTTEQSSGQTLRKTGVLQLFISNHGGEKKDHQSLLSLASPEAHSALKASVSFQLFAPHDIVTKVGTAAVCTLQHQLISCVNAHQC